jgi:glutaredoxin
MSLTELETCEAHGLRYDPRSQDGCVVCRREDKGGARGPSLAGVLAVPVLALFAALSLGLISHVRRGSAEDRYAAARAAQGGASVGASPRSPQAERAPVAIDVYRTSWCPACEMATAYMRKAGIAFLEHDVEHDPAAAAVARRLNPRGSVPTIDVAGTVLIGWNPEQFESVRQQAESRRAQ